MEKKKKKKKRMEKEKKEEKRKKEKKESRKKSHIYSINETGLANFVLILQCGIWTDNSI